MMMIWGVKGVATVGQEDMIGRAKRYIKHLSNNGDRILLPAPVIAEYLTPFDEEGRNAQLQVLKEVFRIASLDLHAAAICAQIQSQKDLLSEIRNDYGKKRPQIKVDCQIVAIADANRADRLVSHDAGLRKLAEGHVNAIDVPDIKEQKTLF